jgi:Domain of unknown function (DUF4136)
MFAKSLSFPAILFIAVLVSGCASGFSAMYDFDHEHDFSNHKTWAWMSEHPMKIASTDRIPSPLLEPRLMAAITDNLAAKGYGKVEDPESADFVVAFTVGSREEIKVDTYPTFYGGYGYPRGWGGAYYGVGYGTQTQVRQYQKGMLAVDIFDVSEHRPMWHGVATKSITESDRKRMDETIHAAVTAVMANFPPPPEK